MSSEMNDVSLDEVSTNLRSYGRWLEARSDVELGADVDLLDDLAELDEEDEPSRRPRVLAGIAAAAALVGLVAVGLGVDGRDSGDGEGLEAGPAGDGVVVDERNGDIPTSGTGRPARPAVGTDSGRAGPGGSADPGGPTAGAEGRADGGAVAAPAATATGDGDGRPPPDDADPATVGDPAVGSGDADADATGDSAVPPSTVDGNDDPPPTTGAGDSNRFVAPSSGAVIDLNETNTLQVEPVPGATRYVFEGWQNEVAVLSLSVDGPTVMLPSRLISAGMTAQVEPGALRLTVSALDAAGAVVGSSQIDVVIAGSPTIAGRGVLGDSPFPTDP